MSESAEEENPIDQIAVSGVLEITKNQTGQLLDPSRNGKTSHVIPLCLEN